jgi:hypothetical protein
MSRIETIAGQFADQFAVLAEASELSLIITEAEASASLVGLVNVTEADLMRQHGAVSRKYVASRGVAGEMLVISVEPVSATAEAVTVTVVSVLAGEVRWLVGEGVNSYGPYRKHNGAIVPKRGNGYGLTVTSTPAEVAEVLAEVIWSAVGATYGAEVRDPLAWLFDVETWHHDARFINGGEVTRQRKVAYAD